MEKQEFGIQGRAVLLGLMTLGGEASNPQLREHIGYVLDGKLRRRLEELGYTEGVKGFRGAYQHTLKDKGWLWCEAELSAPIPARPGSLGGALYGVLRLLAQHLEAADQRLVEFVGEARSGAAETVRADPEALIREVYWKLAAGPQDWVLLSKLRPLLGTLARDAADETLRRMEQLPDVHLVPEADQKTLTEDDRDAAVSIGGVRKHLIAIEAR